MRRRFRDNNVAARLRLFQRQLTRLVAAARASDGLAVHRRAIWIARWGAFRGVSRPRRLSPRINLLLLLFDATLNKLSMCSVSQIIYFRKREIKTKRVAERLILFPFRHSFGLVAFRQSTPARCNEQTITSRFRSAVVQRAARAHRNIRIE